MSICIKASDWREHLWLWLSILSRHSFLEILFLNYLQMQQGFGSQLHHLTNCATWALGPAHCPFRFESSVWLAALMAQRRTDSENCCCQSGVSTDSSQLKPGILVCPILLLCSPSWRTPYHVSRFWRSLFHPQGVLSVRIWFALSGAEICFPNTFMFLFWKLSFGTFNYL